MKSSGLRNPKQKIESVSLLLFFPFAAGVIFFRFFEQTAGGFAAGSFLPALLLLLYSASSVYGAVVCPPLFFVFGCCAALTITPVSPADFKAHAPALAAYALWFPAAFAVGHMTLEQSRALRHGGGKHYLQACLQTNAKQALLLLMAQLIGLYIKRG